MGESPAIMNVVLTSVDLQDIASGGEVVLAPGTLVTALARDDAAQRGISLRVLAAGNRTKDGVEAVVSAAPLIVAAPAAPVVGETSSDGLIRAVTEGVIAYLSRSPRSQLGRWRSAPDSLDHDGHTRERRGSRARLTVQAVAALIDHTLLKPDATHSEIDRLCHEAIEYGFATVCVNPWYVPLAARLLHGSMVKVCTVVGFPLGATLPKIKAHEAEEAIKLGAQEIDVVQNIGALKSGQNERVEVDLRGVVEISHSAGAICKVILETGLLSREEKVRGALLAKRAGADFVKTSTGFASGGATVEDVALLRETVGGEIGVKASGGIRNLDDLRAMVTAGATRIGSSSGVKIVQQIRGTPEVAAPSRLSGGDPPAGE
jgi:deoxyribose-phosphate aldolase